MHGYSVLGPNILSTHSIKLGFQVPWHRPQMGRYAGTNGALMDDGEVVVNVLGNPPRYPSLAVVYYASTIEDIIRWFEGSPAPSVLVPTHLFGPDVIIKCAGGLHLIGQTKSCLTGNINELNATTTEDAINSLNSANWFIKTVCLPDSWLSLLTFCGRNPSCSEESSLIQ